MLKRILVVLSGTPYTRVAIRHAMELARRREARVTGITILDKEAAVRRRPLMAGARGEPVPPLAEARDRIEAAVAEFEAAAREADVDHRLLHDEGHPIDALCDAWRYEDLTLVGLRGLFEYEVFAEPKDAVTKLVSSGMRPILAVSNHHVPIRRVLIAYSGSLESAKTMKRYMQLGLWPEATVKLLHYIEGGEKESEYRQLLADATAYCLDWGVDVEVKALAGAPAEHLLRDAANEHADLIVLGDSARSLLTRRMFGDTALQVIRNADRPLFLSH